MSKHKRTIIWAVDAFSEKDLQTKGIKTLQMISDAFELEIEPVYVLTSNQVQIRSELFPSWAVDYEKASENLLEQLVKHGQFKHIHKPKILVEGSENLRGASQALLKYAKEKHAKLIFTNTHATKGLPRFFLGSFAETLLLQSTLPVLVTNPTTEVPDKIKHILFPTDFFRDAHPGLEDAVHLASKLKAKLTLYHKETTPLYLNFPEAPFYNVYIDDISKQIKKNTEKWLQWVKSQGMSCDVYTDTSMEEGPVGKHILSFAEKNNVDFICLVTKSSALGAAVLGSTARYLVRHSHCPVWVQHPN